MEDADEEERCSRRRRVIWRMMRRIRMRSDMDDEEDDEDDDEDDEDVDDGFWKQNTNLLPKTMTSAVKSHDFCLRSP